MTPGNAPAAALAAWEHCRELLAGCEAAIRAGHWQHAREISESYQEALQALAACVRDHDADTAGGAALLQDIAARHRRIMGELERVMQRVNEDRISLGHGLQAMTMQRRFLDSLPCCA